MKIALDYDDTYTKDPKLWGKFVSDAKEHGHSVTLVTFRRQVWNNKDIEKDAEEMDIPVVYTDRMQKSLIFRADIWIDDSPETIPTPGQIRKHLDRKEVI